MSEKKCFMIIERCLSPPHLNKRELIYCGREIELTEIPKKLGLERETARNYWYTITKLERKNSELSVYRGCFDYDEIQSGRRRDGYSGLLLSLSLDLLLESKTKKSIIDLLSE